MRTRKVENQEKLDQYVDDLITQGYKIKTQGESTALLKKSEYGSAVAHLIIFILFGWWLFLIPNLVYALYRNQNGDEVLVKIQT